MIEEHATLAPSSAPQWGVCSGSVMASLGAADLSSERARDGTASHWVGAECLEHGGHCDLWIGKTAPNGVVISEEMAEGAQVWVDNVQSVTSEYPAHHTTGRLVEQRVKMPGIHPENWGTLDTALHVAAANVLYLWDYKFGHREVTAEGNLQLINYVAGLVVPYNLNAETLIVMRIVQPFCYHAPETVREWKVSLSELTPYFNQLTSQAHEALTVPTMTAGKHCRDCPAIARCATARRSSYSVATYAGEPYQIETMTGAELAVEREILSAGYAALKARLEAVDDGLYRLIADGDTGSGLSIQSKRGRLKWTVAPDVAQALATQFGTDISKAEVVTPTQAIAKIDPSMRDAFKDVLQTLTERPTSGSTLVKTADSRNARAFKPRSIT